MVERFNRTLGGILRQFVSSPQDDWDELLPMCMCALAYNSSRHSSTSYSSNFLMFGRDFRVQLELMLPPLMKIWMQPLRLITSSTMLSHLLIAPEPEHSLHFVYASILFKMTSCWVPMESIQHYLMVYLWYHQLPLESSTIHHPLVPYQAVSNGNVP